VDLVQAQLGKPYRLGAVGPAAFDCSGLTQWAYGQVGIALPRTARQQSEISFATRVTANFLPGDLLFFATDNVQPQLVTHVGVYVGQNKWVSAQSPLPPPNGQVIEDLTTNPWWSARFLFALRIPGVATPGPGTSIRVAFVDSAGRQWADLNDTLNLTWNEVAAVCPTNGVTKCSGSVGSVDVTGWIWATRQQWIDLFLEVTGLSSFPSCTGGPCFSADVLPLFHSAIPPTFDSRQTLGWLSSPLPTVPNTAFVPITNDFLGHANDQVGFGNVNKELRLPVNGVYLFR
jgi:hypothetical protein